MTLRFACCSVILICVVGLAWNGQVSAADVRQIVPGYDGYRTSSFLQVDRGTVRAEKVADWAYRLVIEVPEGEGQRVRLTATGYWQMRLLDLRNRRRISASGNQVELEVGGDGVGWFVLFAPPPQFSIYEYDPKPQLKLEQHTPLKARHPVVDVHVHVSARNAKLEDRLRVMDAAGIAIAIDSPMANAGQVTEDSYGQFERRRPDRFLTFATIDFTRRHEPGFAEEAIRKLRRDVERLGVVGIGETHDKGSGLFGYALMPVPREPVHIEDPRVMPIWRAAARMKLPVLIHTADPPGFYAPLDRHNEHLPRIARSPWFYLGGLPILSGAELRRRRNRILEQLPDLQIIAAHMDNLPVDLKTVGKTLRRYPNLYLEVGMRYPQLARQPRTARKFFIEFQDRVLYGGDGVQSIESYRFQFRVFETDDDSFSPPGRRVGPYFLYGLNLPDVVLKKLYYANAARLMPKVRERLLALHPNLDFPE